MIGIIFISLKIKVFCHLAGVIKSPNKVCKWATKAINHITILRFDAIRPILVTWSPWHEALHWNNTEPIQFMFFKIPLMFAGKLQWTTGLAF